MTIHNKSIHREILQERSAGFDAALQVMQVADEAARNLEVTMRQGHLNLTPLGRAAFWLLICYQAADRAGMFVKQRQPPQMSPDVRHRFGARRLRFGRHAGKPLRKAPRSYLSWLANLPHPFADFQRELRRYLDEDPQFLQPACVTHPDPPEE